MAVLQEGGQLRPDTQGVGDGTAEEVRLLARDHSCVRLIRRVGRYGLSSAIKEGILDATGDVVVVMDSDGQHEPAAVASTACGAQATPALAKWAFSSARSWHTATASAAGATVRVRASCCSTRAGTFSNSVLMAWQQSLSCLRA